MNMKIDFDTFLKQAKDMQSKMESTTEELAKIEIIGESGGGLVKLHMNGRYVVTYLWLDPSLLKESKEFVEELLIGGFNDAIKKIEKSLRQKLLDLTEQVQTKFSDKQIQD